jgi:transcriptional regulator with XRE-family HTH domain
MVHIVSDPFTSISPAVGASTPVGAQLRDWRQRRRRSQLDLALDAEISQRHLSFVESGRSLPSRGMVLRLAETLDVPLRDRNALLLAAGFAPVYGERPLTDPALAGVRGMVETIVQAHAPNPALAIDRHWTLLSANAAVTALLASVSDPELLQPPVNVLRLSLHPTGLALAISNLPVWRAHLLGRLRREVIVSGDPVLLALLQELSSLGPVDAEREVPVDATAVAVPLELETRAGRLSLISTTTVFGTPTEVTLSELAIEAFYPADAATASRLLELQPRPPSCALSALDQTA